MDIKRQLAFQLDLQGFRQCIKCTETKPHCDMKKDIRNRFGIQSVCKLCDQKVWPKCKRAQMARLRKHAVSEYAKAMKKPLWDIVERAIIDLEINSDLELKTPSKYIVGYIVQKLLGDSKN